MSELNEKILEIKNQKDTYIIPGNLKKNVTVFGVTGTYEGSSGDVKLFDTVEHMQQDPSPQEGDLACVYREEIQPVQEESEFSSCVFPNTVVLYEAFEYEIYGRFRAVDPSVMFDGSVNMTSSRFRFNGYGDSSEIRVEYTSSDGITYTRTDGGEELQEFGTAIKYEPMEPWNDIIGNFMKVSGNYFDGMYKYTLNNVDNTKIRFVPASNCEIDISNRKIIADTTSNYTDVDKDILIEILNNFAIEKSVGGVTINDVLNRTFLYLRSDNNIGIAYNVVGSGDNAFVQVLFNVDNSIKGICCDNLPLVNADYSTTTVEEYLVNVNNKTCEKVNTSSNRSTINVDGAYRYLYYMPIENISVNSILIKAGSWDEHGIFDLKAIYSCSIQTTDTDGYESLDVTYKLDRLYNSYIIAKSQLDITSDYVYEKAFYGKNGIQLGNLNSNTINSINKRDVLLNIADTMQAGYIIEDGINFSDYTGINIPFNLNTSSMTNMNSMFEGCFNLTTAPEMDTSNVTSMSHMFVYDNHLTSVPNWNTSNVLYTTEMFWDCYNLTSVPNWDLSNATILHGMFNGCTGLQNVPNFNTQNATSMINMFKECFSLVNAPNLVTNNVTSMYGMFNKCGKLVNVPDYNTINVTNLSYMFSYCSKLVNAPNFVTDNVIAISGMFNGCSNLVNVPQYNTAKVNSMGSMFAYCNNLTNASIQNIINMCLNSNITSQWYKDLNTNNSSSPLFRTKFTNSYYSNRLSELTTAGWTY